MRQILEILTGLLLEQRSILADMLNLSLEKRRIIMNCETEKLESIVRLELRELSKLGAIEKKRASLHKALAIEFNLPDNDITVTAIAERASQEERETITKLQTELTALIEQHTDINTENRELIKAHLEYTEAMLEMMVDAEDPLNNFYGGDGKMTADKRKTTGFFNGHA